MPPLVLAVEPDQRQAVIVKRLVRERLQADLVLADSKDGALAALGDRVPDVVLLSALLSPREETELTDHLRGLDAADHVQTLTIPLLANGPAPAPEPPRRTGLLAKFSKRAKPAHAAPAGCDPSVFGDELMTYIARARELRAERARRLGPDVSQDEVADAPPIEAIAAASFESFNDPDTAADPVAVAPAVPDVTDVAIDPVAVAEPLPEPVTPAAPTPVAAAAEEPPIVEAEPPVAAPSRPRTWLERARLRAPRPERSVAVAPPRDPLPPPPEIAAAADTEIRAASAKANPPADHAIDPLAPGDDQGPVIDLTAELDNTVEPDPDRIEPPAVARTDEPEALTVSLNPRNVSEPRVETPRAAAPAPAPAAAPAPDPIPTLAVDARWIASAIDALRLDIQSLRGQQDPQAAPAKRPEPARRAEPPATAQAAKPQREATPKKKRKAAAPKPIQDEWGVYDPNQCGFEALFAELESIQAEEDAPAVEEEAADQLLQTQPEEVATPPAPAPLPPPPAVGPQRELVHLSPLAMWARVERPHAETYLPGDELLGVLAGLRVPSAIASVRYASGCRIRRVRVARLSDGTEPREREREREEGKVVILSKKTLRNQSGKHRVASA